VRWCNESIYTITVLGARAARDVKQAERKKERQKKMSE